MTAQRYVGVPELRNSKVAVEVLAGEKLYSQEVLIVKMPAEVLIKMMTLTLIPIAAMDFRCLTQSQIWLI